MKITCEKHLLQNAINTASRAASPKSPIQALEGLLIEASEGIMQITGYDLKRGIYTCFPAEIKDPTAIVLDSRLFGEITRRLPEGIVSIETQKDLSVVISSGNAEFSIMGRDAGDYPELPSIDRQKTITLEQGKLRNMISETIFAVSDNEARPVYTGELFQLENNKLSVVAVDGYRLGLRREEIISADEFNEPFIVPATALSDVEKICGDNNDPVRINVGAKHVSFSIGDTVIISRRLDGEFLDFNKTINAEYPTVIAVERTELYRVADRVSLIIDERTRNPLRCVIGEDEINFSCTTPLGKAVDICGIDGDGNGLEIGFNNRYLLDAVKNAPTDRLKMFFNTGSSPCIIRPEDKDNDSFVYMILPVRLRND